MSNTTLTPLMEQALDAITRNDQPVFTSVLWDVRPVHCISGNTMHALLRRGLVEVDHMVEHPEPWVIPTVYYRRASRQGEQR